MFEETNDALVAQQWATELLGELNSAKYYFAPETLLSAYKTPDSFSFVVDGDLCYGQTYGPNPHLDRRCTKVAVEGIRPDSMGGLIPRNGFEFWGTKTSLRFTPIEILTDMAEVDSIIDEHAPDSSVRPGGTEEVFWGGIRNEQGDLASLAVLVKWQSGMHVLSSVVTRTQDRGKGLATVLSVGMASHSYSLGIDEVGLGVRDTNVAAQRAYAKAGFKRLGVFTNYFRE